jgi:phosphohistidine swiveling domain-containing protein
VRRMGKIQLVINLDSLRGDDSALVGSKALSLIKLNRLGFNVPAGFCVTSIAYREHLKTNGMILQLNAYLAGLKNAAPADKNRILSDIRRVIIQAPLSEMLSEQIGTHYHKLVTNYVAVRSSATAEDLPGHSFAGQYDTFLGIANLEGCLNAIRKCWASLWTLRAYEYRQKNDFDHLKVSMAVIVQKLIPADTSGVLFTADPRFGPSGNIVIEACFGLGQALVSGKVTPDRFVVDRNKLRLLFREISEKKIECVFDREETVREQKVTDERSIACSLDKKQIKRLAKFAKRVEVEFACPQDIEWAVYKNKIYLLQSRPITGIPQERSREDRQIWSAPPAREVLPDVVTPVTLSMVLESLGEGFFDPVFRMLGCDRGDLPYYSTIAGRLYFNANIWGAMFRRVPGVRNFDFMTLTGSNKYTREAMERLLTVPDEDLPDVKFSLLKFIFRMPLAVIGAIFCTPEKGRRIMAKINAENEKLSSQDVASLSAEQITTCFQELTMHFRELLSHGMYLFGWLAALPVLDILYKKWFPDGGSCTGKLLAGIGDMDDAAAGLELWQLAASADTKPDVKHLILSEHGWCNIKPKLAQTNSGKEFLKTWDDFMKRHGHHCRAELELYNPRWAETPDYILTLLRSYLAQIGKTDPIQNYNRLRQERRQLEQQCRQQLKNPLKRMIFNHLLVRSQYGSVFRENVKSEVIKLIVAMRKMLIELGRRLQDKGVLMNQDDIFFLRLEEIEPVAQRKADFDIHKVIAARRAEYDKNRSIMPPDVVFGKFDPDKYIPDTVDTNVETLNGLAVSPGIATGKARVILRADTDEQILAGEILVAPFTDPGWTPYFVTAVAVVMDQGSILSHGSIVAREYGIPAVVNVGHATEIIKTGQTIQVDGNRGIVKIIQ